jgi:hypothetical protein
LADDQVEVDLWHVSHMVTPTCTAVLGLPTAGGKLPLWQVEHCAETEKAL